MKILKIMIFCIVFFGSCKKEIQNEIEVKNVFYSDCKDNSEEQESIRLEVSMQGELRVTHNNTIFNCCSDELKIDVSLNENILIFNEHSTKSLCNCICPYDIGCTLDEVTNKEYIFRILKENLEYYEFNVTLSSNLDTTIIIN